MDKDYRQRTFRGQGRREKNLELQRLTISRQLPRVDVAADGAMARSNVRANPDRLAVPAILSMLLLPGPPIVRKLCHHSDHVQSPQRLALSRPLDVLCQALTASSAIRIPEVGIARFA